MPLNLSNSPLSSPRSPEYAPWGYQYHAVNFIVRQKQPDTECVYIDCCLKGNTESRMKLLNENGYTRGPVQSTSFHIKDRSVIRISTRGDIRLAIDGGDDLFFDLKFDSQLESCGEEGWVSPARSAADERQATSQHSDGRCKGFVTFSVRCSSLAPEDQHLRVECRQTHGTDSLVGLCSLPLSISKPLEPHSPGSRPSSVKPQETAAAQAGSKSPFWNPIATVMEQVPGNAWTKLGSRLDYEATMMERFRDTATADDTAALGNLLMDYFKRRRDSADTIPVLSGALQSMGYKDVANVIIQKDHNAEEDRKFKRIVHELAKDADLLQNHQHFLRMLGLPDHDLASIKFEHKSLQEILRSGVMKWRSNTGVLATIDKLIECLRTTGHQRLAEHITDNFDTQE